MIAATKIPSVKTFTPKRFSDDRGYFSETWNEKAHAAMLGDVTFVQDNHSLSIKAGTVRGLHCQSPPHAQNKLVRVVFGSILDVAVDIRAGSPYFGMWVAEELSRENGKQLFIPAGFLHGFITLAPNTEVLYKCSDFYAPACDRAVRFDDPSLGIEWGRRAGEVILSEKDAHAPLLSEFETPFIYGGES